VKENKKESVDPWTKVAFGDVGDQIFWESGFESLGSVHSILSNFELLGDHEEIDWDVVVGGHHYFDGIKDWDFPPLYNVADFENLFSSDFSADVTTPVDPGRPGSWFNSIELYVRTDKKDQIVNCFQEFEKHLASLQVLQKAGIV
jgi:hypothetical protein